MNRASRVPLWLRRVVRAMLSVPVFFKILGIGLLVAAVFGAVTLFQVRASISRTLYQLQEERAWATASSLAAAIERPMTVGDQFAVREQLLRTRQTSPSIRYLLVEDARGTIVNHTFERGVPDDLAAFVSGQQDRDEAFDMLATPEGGVFHVRYPILDGDAGAVHVGLSDLMITRQLAAVTRSVWLSLGLCVVIGAGLALLLTHILTMPIQHLARAAQRIQHGDFEARSAIYYDDEIGRLAAAFNQMTEGLQRYHDEVDQRGRDQQALLAKIVYAQEEERRNISRELHDQLGQSLLALLLAVQTGEPEDERSRDGQQNLADRIRQIIDEVRRLAWGMHPSILDDYGLDFALTRHVQQLGTHPGLAVDYQSTAPPGQGRLSREVEVTLYRVAQEALTNVVRYSQAAQCSVVLLRDRDEVTLLVEDDGCGFDPGAVARRRDGGLGLTGIRERVALVGGRCEIESSPGAGTTVRVRVPSREGDT